MIRWRLAIVLALLLAGGVFATYHVSTAQQPGRLRAQVVILVDAETQARIAAQLERYRADAASSLAPVYGRDVRIDLRVVDLAPYRDRDGLIPETQQNELTRVTAQALEKLYREGLVGIVLVGRVPLPRAYEDGKALLTLYPWMDFDEPAYAYDPAEGRYLRAETVDPRPEIWSGVIREPGDASTATPYSDVTLPPATLETFFDRDHAAHAGQPTVPRRILVNNIALLEQFDDMKTGGGERPDPNALPGGAEPALKAYAQRMGTRLASTGRYDGVNLADDGLPRNKDTQSYSLTRLLEYLRTDSKNKDLAAVARFANGETPLKSADVADQVITYFDAWVPMRAGVARVSLVQSENSDGGTGGSGDGSGGGTPEDRRGSYTACLHLSGDGFFARPAAEREAAARAAGLSLQEYEFLLLWGGVLTRPEKRAFLVDEGIPPFGKYRSAAGVEITLQDVPGDDAYRFAGGPSLTGSCFRRGVLDGRRGRFMALRGAATGRETTNALPTSLALWAASTGPTLAAYGALTGPPVDVAIPESIDPNDGVLLDRIASSLDVSGFGRFASLPAGLDGIGFEQDPFVLSLLAGAPFGEAVRPHFDATSILYGDPTLRFVP